MEKKLDGLDGWLNVSTWYTPHPSDQERFYKAAFKVIQENRGLSIHGSDISEYIESKYKGKLSDEFLRSEAEKSAELFETIEWFCKANNL